MADYDVIIIGGGPAGMAALIWCHSLGLNATLLEKESQPGGQLLQMYHRLMDYPGMIGSGIEIRESFVQHIQELKLDFKLNCKIEKINWAAKTLQCNDDALHADSIIIATGARKRKLNIPGEDKFALKGVSFSGTRDHSLYAGKNVCVIGGGDSAVENALILSRVCPSVTLIHRSDNFRARSEWLQQAQNTPSIKFVTNAYPVAIEGSDKVERIKIADTNTKQITIINTEAVFIKTGITPNTEFFGDAIEKNASGYIKVDSRFQTSINGVYAIGDVTNPECMSLATAVGHAALATKNIFNTKT